MHLQHVVAGMLVREPSQHGNGLAFMARKVLYASDRGVLTEIIKHPDPRYVGTVTFFKTTELDFIRYWEPYNEQTTFFIFLNKKNTQTWDEASCHKFDTLQEAEQEKAYFRGLKDDVSDISKLCVG